MKGKRKTRWDPFPIRVWSVVEKIPKGKVLSYSDVALLAGSPRGARIVAWALRIAQRSDLPWHRVVGKGGEIRILDPPLRREQIRRLEAEGIRVVQGRIDFERHRLRELPD